MMGIFLDFLILYQVLFSAHAKRSVIISNKNGIHELPHELDIRKSGRIRKISKHGIIIQRPTPAPRRKPLPILAKNCRKIEIRQCTISHEN